MPALGIALIVLAFVAPAVASKYMSRRQAALPQHQATIRSATRIPETDDLELVVDIFPVGGMSYELKYTIQDQPYAGYYQYRPGTRVLVRLSPDVLPTIMDMILDPAYEAELRDISTWPRFPAVILETQVVGTIENDAAFHEFRLRIEPHDKAAYETDLRFGPHSDPPGAKGELRPHRRPAPVLQGTSRRQCCDHSSPGKAERCDHPAGRWRE